MTDDFIDAEYEEMPDEGVEEIFNQVCDELEDEIERSEAYREAAICLLDTFALNAVKAKRKERMEKLIAEGSPIGDVIVIDQSNHTTH
jgi:hypothetical protein